MYPILDFILNPLSPITYQDDDISNDSNGPVIDTPDESEPATQDHSPYEISHVDLDKVIDLIERLEPTL